MSYADGLMWSCSQLLSFVQLLCNPPGLQPSRLLCPWDFPGKTTGVGCHFLLQGIFLNQGSNTYLFLWKVLRHQGSPGLSQGCGIENNIRDTTTYQNCFKCIFSKVNVLLVYRLQGSLSGKGSIIFKHLHHIHKFPSKETPPVTSMKVLTQSGSN